MAKLTTEELLQQFADLTLVELSEFVKAFEETFDVTAAAPVAVAAGDKKIQVIKVVRELTSLGLGEAKAVVDGAPKAVLEGANKETAEKAQAALQEAGATVTLK